MPFGTLGLRDRAVALYGRFSPGVRERLVARVEHAGGHVARDLTRRSHVFVVGALATTLIDSGALGARLRSAAARGVRIIGERAFAACISGQEPGAAPTLPLSTALAQTPLTRGDADILAAFDLIVIEHDSCRFGDAAILRTAKELRDRGRSLADVVRILSRARDLSPLGRHKIVLMPSGEAALQWDDGLTTLEGQGYFPLDEDHATIDDLFEGAALAEANGDLADAARLYDMCGRADRNDAIAPYNLGNIHLAQGASDHAVLAYQQALARDATFTEARYNLAQALEATGKLAAAETELGRVLDVDPNHPDALFNLAQLRMKVGETRSAKALFERYLAQDPPDAWAATARKAILYCAASRPA